MIKHRILRKGSGHKSANSLPLRQFPGWWFELLRPGEVIHTRPRDLEVIQTESVPGGIMITLRPALPCGAKGA